MLKWVWAMDAAAGVFVKWEVTSMFIQSVSCFGQLATLTYPGRSPRADKGSGGVRAGAVLKRFSWGSSMAMGRARLRLLGVEDPDGVPRIDRSLSSDGRMDVSIRAWIRRIDDGRPRGASDGED